MAPYIFRLYYVMLYCTLDSCILFMRRALPFKSRALRLLGRVYHGATVCEPPCLVAASRLRLTLTPPPEKFYHA